MKRRCIVYAGTGVLVVLLVIQFIRPQRNESADVQSSDITNAVSVPPDIQSILKKACYDCHSNNTVYPWYSNVQPVGWMLANHVNEGKAELNFSEFGKLSKRRRASKMKAVAMEVKHDEMPLASYKLIHPAARLNDEEKQRITAWADSLAQNE